MRNQIFASLSTVALILSFAAPSGATPYTDDSQIAPWSKESVQTLLDLGIMSGYPDGSFRPSSTLTRQEYAHSLLQGLDLLEAKVLESITLENNLLYEELVNQQIVLMQALTEIDQIKAKSLVQNNNYLALGLGYGVSNENSDDVSNVHLLGKFQVVSLSDTFSISVRPFVMSDSTAGVSATIDASLSDTFSVYAGAGSAANWNNGGQLTGSSDVVPILNAGLDLNLSKNTVTGLDLKLPLSGSNSSNPVITGFVGLRF